MQKVDFKKYQSLKLNSYEAKNKNFKGHRLLTSLYKFFNFFPNRKPQKLI